MNRDRIPLPAFAPPPARGGIPVVAALAPLAVAGVLWAVTRSPFALVFALLGPLMLVAGVVDARMSARRALRREVAATRRRIEAVRARVAAAHDVHRERLERAAPELAARVEGAAAAWESPGEVAYRLGLGSVPAALELTGDDPEGLPPELATAFADLRVETDTTSRAAVAVDHAHLALSGPAALVRGLARALVVQAACLAPPEAARIRLPADECWAGELPHAVEWTASAAEPWRVAVGGRTLLRIDADAALAGPRALLVDLDAASGGTVGGGRIARDLVPLAASRAEASARARRLAEVAREAGRGGPSRLPRRVDLSELLADDDPAPDQGLTAPIGRDADGVVSIDILRHGPHALVAGTTGSGKSELLVSWVLGLAHRYPPTEVGFLLVDFKGGAAFAPLDGVPHVVGVVSDLDPVVARRAVESLRAELRRRERVLVERGARSIDDLASGGLARLIIVVDEFAALADAHPDLHAVFADLAARGRSLGLHLLVCTQRPAGVVREGVLANITARVCLRVLDAGDSAAVVGSPDAARLPVEARGRAVVLLGDRARIAQLAIADDSTARRVRERWAAVAPPVSRPWLDPLPAVLVPGALPRPTGVRGEPGGGLVVGLVDVPEEQRREPLVLDPWHAGAVLVLGAGGAGRTGALRSLERAARDLGIEVRAPSDDPAEVWHSLAAAPQHGGRVLCLLDDLDRTWARSAPEARGELMEHVARAARDASRTGLAVVATARGGVPHTISAAFEQRLLLRLASREEHVLAGGDGSGYLPQRLAGSCLWRGREAQLAWDALPLERWTAELPVADLTRGAWAVVCPRVGEALGRLQAAGVPAIPLDGAAAPVIPKPGMPAPTAPAPGVVVGDVDGWLAAYAALSAVRRDGRLLLVDATPADHRAVTRSRAVLPPLSASGGEAWLVEGDRTTRVRVQPR